MSTGATTDLLAMIQHAAGTTKVVSGDRSPGSVEAAEPKRPYFRVQFMRLGGQTGVPGRMRGVAMISCFARDQVEAWSLCEALSEALKLTRRGFQIPDHPTPSRITYYEPVGDGWQRGTDPRGGGLAYTSITFHYLKAGV